MKTKHFLPILFLLIICVFSCEPDEPEGISKYDGTICSLDPEPASRGQEVTLTISYSYPNPSSEMEIFVDGIPVTIIENNTTSVRFILPDDFYTLIIRVEHSDGWIKEKTFKKQHKAVITGFSPTTGKAGDVVTITGVDLTGCYLDSLQVMFNTAVGEIISANDTIITVKVPQNAGSGYIRIYHKPDMNNSCGMLDIKSEDAFTYQFETGVEKFVSREDSWGDEIIEYKRDNQNRLTEIVMVNSGYYYQKFFYGNDGLIDTINYYDRQTDELLSSSVYNHSQYPEKIEVLIYHKIYSLQLGAKIVYSYSNNRLQTKEVFDWIDPDFVLDYTDRYAYEGNIAYRYSKLSGGAETLEDEWEYDLFNKVLDLNIPGKEIIHAHNIIKYGNSEYNLIYDQYGYLIEIEKKNIIFDDEFEFYKSFTYE